VEEKAGGVVVRYPPPVMTLSLVPPEAQDCHLLTVYHRSLTSPLIHMRGIVGDGNKRCHG